VALFLHNFSSHIFGAGHDSELETLPPIASITIRDCCTREIGKSTLGDVSFSRSALHLIIDPSLRRLLVSAAQNDDK